MIGRVSVSGDKDLMKALNALGERVKKQHLMHGLMEAAEPIRARMEQLAPVDTDPPVKGREAHIKDHIGISPAKSVEGVRLHEDEAAVAVGPTRGFFYGWFQEFGTAEHPAQAFVRPAFDQEHRGALARMRGVLWNALKGSAR
jgi:HK97 gp10 family phage protein